ncbi:MAG: hypothetical protein JNK01_02260 [Devosia sp.]|nr:hypothetical protein [Devosia sp.]
MSAKSGIVSYTPRPLTEEERAELRALAERPDEEIDYSDIPKTTEEFWKNALVNPHMYPPIRLDRRVVEWFRERADDDGSIMLAVNRVLLDYIAAEKKKARKKAG